VFFLDFGQVIARIRVSFLRGFAEEGTRPSREALGDAGRPYPLRPCCKTTLPRVSTTILAVLP